jgi:hypothetical protein
MAETLSAVPNKARFWERCAKQPLNERQIKVLIRVMDGFEVKLTSSKWAKIAKCSPDTALRDITDLLERGALRKDPGGGPSTAKKASSGKLLNLLRTIGLALCIRSQKGRNPCKFPVRSSASSPMLRDPGNGNRRGYRLLPNRWW